MESDEYKVKWIKIVTDIFDDDKIKIIESLPDGYAMIVAWFKVLCLAGKSNVYGMLMLNEKIAYTDEMLAAVFRMPINTVRYALDTFEKLEMIERTDVGAVAVVNWEKHQNVKTLDDMRQKGKERVRRFRERQKQALLESGSQSDTECNVTGNVNVYVTSNGCNADVTDKNKDIENIENIENKEKNIIKKKNSKTDYSDEFETFWKIYPRPDGKIAAYKCWNTRLKEGYTADHMIAGATAYARQTRKKKTDREYIKLPSTFLGPNLWFKELADINTPNRYDDETDDTDRIMQEYFDGV